MATILAQEQVNPWAIMAANLGTQLLTGMLERNRQADENRKLNALMSEVQNGVNAQRNQGAVQNFTTQNNIMPDGYDVNPWAKAFHQNYTPMTQYNIGTADVNPLIQAQATQETQNPATVQDYRAEAMKQLASKRFGMLNPAMVEQYLTPFYQGLTQQNQEAKKQAAIDAIRNAQGNDGRLLEAQLGAAQGLIPDSVMSSMQNQRNFDTTMGYNTSKDALAQANFMRNFEAGRNDEYWNRGYRERQMAANERQWEDEKNNFTNLVTGYDGNMYGVDRYGNTKKLDLGTYDENSGTRLTADDKYTLENLQKEYDKLNEERQAYIKQASEIAKATGSSFFGEGEIDESKLPGMGMLNDNIARVESEMAGLRKQINTVWSKVRGISSSDVNPLPKKDKTNIASLILGKNVTAHEHGTFNYDRGDHKHAGTDYPVGEGTPIKLDKSMGDNFTVKRVRNDKDGYGNYLDIEGTRNGKKVEYRFAHLQEGGINVKEGDKINIGDVIAKSGGTKGTKGAGRSSGAHLHLEVKVDGKAVDPDSFFNEYGDIEEDRPISDEGYAQLLKMVNAGEFPGMKTEADLQNMLKKYGTGFNASAVTGIKSQDVTPFTQNTPYYGFDKRNFRR